MDLGTLPKTGLSAELLGRILDQPLLWEVTRNGLDLTFGLYRRRVKVMNDWGLLDKDPTVLDIGCGIGSYAGISAGEYMGLDMNPRYISHATSRRGSERTRFRCADVVDVLKDELKFDLVLMVDFLHHLDIGACKGVLSTATSIALKYIVSFEPVLHQGNPVGQWIIDHDRGEYIRPLDDLLRLFEASGLRIIRSAELMLGPIKTQVIVCPGGALADQLGAPAP